jgi:hypothetical protein
VRRHAKASSAGSIESTGSARGSFRRALATRGTSGDSKGSGAPARRSVLIGLIAAIAMISGLATAAPALAAPAVTSCCTISNISYTSAQVSGKGSHTGQFAVFRFEVSTDGTNWTAPLIRFDNGAGTNKTAEGEISGLEGGTEYFVRLTVAETLSGESATSPEAQPYPSFTTLVADPPTIPGPVVASPVFSTSATVSGKVIRPVTSDDVTCRFEYISDDQFEENVNVNSAPGFTGATPVDCAQSPIGQADAGSEKEVTAQLNGLIPATSYHLRLVAENASPDPVVKDAASLFTTDPKVAEPVIVEVDDAADVSYKSATFTGEVERPAGIDPALDVNCRFEYITDQQFDENVANSVPPFEGAGQAGCPEPITSPDPGHPAVKAEVKAEPTDLLSGATYHLRLVAENSGGTVGKEVLDTFTTIPGADTVATIDPNPAVGYTTAQVSGTITPGELEKDQFHQWYFQYTEVGTEEWGGEAGIGSAGSGGGIPDPGSTDPIHVSFELTGLKPDTEYEFRLGVGINAQRGFFAPGSPPTATTRHLELPTATLNPVTAVTATTAHFSGTVDTQAPAGPLDALDKAAYKTEWHFECEPDCSGGQYSGVVQADQGSKAISVDATHLEGNTPYAVKLVVHNQLYSAETQIEHFTTPVAAPAVKLTPGASDGEGGYIVEGIVNALGSSVTDCHFNYGPTAAYVFQAPCSPTPVARTEVQELAINSLGGSFNLSFRGQKTADIPFTGWPTTDDLAPPSEIKAALEGLSTIGPGGIASVTHDSGVRSYVVTFSGSLAGLNLPPIVGASSVSDPLNAQNGRPAVVTTTAKAQGGNSVAVLVEAHLTGLTPGATYHVQLVATNGGGTSSSGDQTFVPTQDPTPPPCPNEALRRENNSLALPECRAYEQVSSSAKGGYQANFRGGFGGDSVLYSSSAGNIANSGQGAGINNFYVANRTASGWETIPNLNSGGTIYAGPEGIPAIEKSVAPFFFSEDLQTSYWYEAVGRQFNAEKDSYLREPDGRFTLVGHNTPVTSPGDSRGVVPVGGSADLSHIVVNGDGSHPGVYEFVGTGNGAPRRVDLDSSGQPISECPSPRAGVVSPAAEGEAVSRDGRTIFILAFGNCGAAGPPANEIWARVDGTTSYEASESHCTRPDCNAPSAAKFIAAAKDGSSVFFTTTQQLVDGDTDATRDLYVYRLPTSSSAAALTEVSGTGTEAAVEETATAAVTVSADGSTAMFVSRAALAGNVDALDDTAQQGDDNLYVWRRDEAHPEGQVTFVGRLGQNDLVHGYGLAEFKEQLAKPEMTSDGRYVVLSTASQLTPTDTDEGFDVYRYDAESGELTRVSTGPLGTGGNADGFIADLASRGKDSSRNPWPAALSVSDDGKAVVFSTDEGLVPRDGNGTADVYLWKAGRVSLISSGAAGNNFSEAGEFAIDPSGQDIFFLTSEALSASDGDSVRDVYDARVGGGFSFAEKAAACAGEACRPAGPGAPAAPSPATDQARAPEPPPKATCPKGKVLKKGKCVKKPKKHHGKHKGKRGAKKRGGGK